MTPVDPSWIRGPADALAIDQGCTFDLDLGRRPVEFIERFCRQSKGRWAGTRLELLPWQRDLLMRLFGWRKADGTRRYRRAYVEMPKKNGKSTLISALVIYLTLADGEGAPETYLNAVDREQASIVFDEAARMVRSSPDLSHRLEIVDSKKRINYPANDGKIQANSADVPSKDGINASAVIFDELHRLKSREMWDIFEYAGASREQPLTITITTAGEDRDGVWHEQRENSDQVNAGAIPDITHLGVVYRALETDDLDDPATWHKANPSLGHTIRVEDFARELAEAKRLPAKWANFLRLRLGIVTREEAKFLAIETWDACQGPPATSRGPAFGGLDLSSTDDLSALVLLVGDWAAGFEVLARFWLPEENIVELERKHKVPYRAWAKAGWIELTPGNVIDYGFIRAAINDLAGDHDLRKLLIDPYNATKIAIDLKDADGLPVEFLRQGFLSLSAPTKELERLVLGRKLRHGGHPILRWNALNAVLARDEAGNIKLSKKKSRLKIDGFAALVNAVAAATTTGDDGGDSVYDRRGLLFL